MDRQCLVELIRNRTNMQPGAAVQESSSVASTLSSDDDDAASAHSIGGNATRGRSVKEFEEQLIHLRKENFNLKLRIYFLEERMGSNFNLDKESAVKKNVELMVEVESLRKELQEKQDLLCQAVKAMELEEEEHKKELQQKDEQMAHFQDQLEELQMKLQDATDHIEALTDAGYSPNVIKELETKVAVLEEELAKEKENSSSLENQLRLANCATVRCENLEIENKQKEEKISELHSDMHEMAKKFSNCNLRVQSLEDEMDARKLELEHKNELLQQREDEAKSLVIEVEKLKSALKEARSLHKEEEKQVEKLRGTLMLRNSKLVELEKVNETQKAKIRTLETKLDSVQHEVKRKTDELETIKNPVHRKKQVTDSDSFSVRDASRVSQKSLETPSPLKHSPRKSFPSTPTESGESLATLSLMEQVKKYKEELSAQDQKILKLKSEQMKACQIIKSMINSRGDNEKENAKLREQIEQLEKENCILKQGNADAVGLHRSKSLHEKISEMNFTANVDAESEKENVRMEAAGDGTELTEKYKQLTVELEKQIQVLKDTLLEKDAQMSHYKQDNEALLVTLKRKDNQIVDLEFELLATSKSNHSINSEKKDNGNEKPASFFLKEIEEKDNEIERLESELKKRTCDLQGIVNKELWEKNREIERLQKRYGTLLEKKKEEIAALESDLSGKDLQLNLLKEKISELGLHVNMPVNLMPSPTPTELHLVDDVSTLQDQIKTYLREKKHLLAQIDELKQRIKNTAEQDSPSRREELEARLEHSERLRKESNEITAVLSGRLEELAQFLQSLLQEKSVLGFLGYKRNSKLQRFITQSLDLSRTLNTSLSQNPDQSLLQLTDISELLNSTRADNVTLSECFKDKEENFMFSIIPTSLSLTYQSHVKGGFDESLEDKSEVIGVLREQVENLKREVELRDRELSKRYAGKEDVGNDDDFVEFLVDMNAPVGNVLPKEKIIEELLSEKTKSSKVRSENHSESESWSEPDRNVSKTRIGLNDESLKPSGAIQRVSTESTEEEELNKSRTPSKKSIMAENRQTIIILHEQVVDLEKRMTEKEKELKEMQIAYYALKVNMNSEKSRSAAEKAKLEDALAAAALNQSKAENKCEELKQVVESLECKQRELIEKMEEKDKIMINKINELEVEKLKALEAVKLAETEAKNAEIAMEVTKKELELARAKINEIKSECNQQIEDNLKAFKEEFSKKIELIERKAEMEVNQANAMMSELQATYEREYVRRSEIERQTLEIERLNTELKNAKNALQNSEKTLQAIEQQDLDVKQKMRQVDKEHAQKINKLHSDLDSATLQYSEAVLEKTKLANEKTALEQTLKETKTKTAYLEKQVVDFQKELFEARDAFNTNLQLVEVQKTKLQQRVSQLEAANAELQSKIIRVQTGRGDQLLVSTSLPSSPNKFFDIYQQNLGFRSIFPYMRQVSDNSGYNSEDHHSDDRRRVQCGRLITFERRPGGTDTERQEENSSPDLGIESDHGRLSSLEAAMPRPMLMTLELTESLNNLLEGEAVKVQDYKCNNESCMKRYIEMSAEINDLKRHLLRTRRTLEETMTRLAISNKRKMQVEKTICKQIHKTSQVLRRAKANLDSGSEVDVRKKT